MKKRERSVRSQLALRSGLGAGVAVAVPATGTIVAMAPAMADPGVATPTATAPTPADTVPTPDATTVTGTPTTGAPTAGPSAATSPSRQAAATAPDPSEAKPVLVFGARGDAVKAVQTQLGVDVDGIFGPITLAAVQSFQRTNGLDVDGIVGRLTWAKLAEVAASTTTPTTPPASTTSCSANATTLRFGSTHPLVKVLQARLGVNPVGGHFGPLTRAAVLAFQTKNGLVADGIVGPLTWAKLGCVDTPTTPTPTPTTPTPTPTTPTPTPTTPTPTPTTPTPTPTTPTPTPTTPTPTPTTPTPTTPTPSSTKAAQIIAYAKTFVGVPYVWGGSTPAGFDCSGLVQYVYAKYGITMPRVAAAQQAYFPATSNPQPGDLLFYGYPAYHVAIYLGDGMMLDAPHPGAFVNVRAIYGTPSSYGRVVS